MEKHKSINPFHFAGKLGHRATSYKRNHYLQIIQTQYENIHMKNIVGWLCNGLTWRRLKNNETWT